MGRGASEIRRLGVQIELTSINLPKECEAEGVRKVSSVARQREEGREETRQKIKVCV